jgi:tmRNA-binding protein
MAIRKAGLAKCLIIPDYGGIVHKGWEIKSLTKEELKLLHAP